MMTYDEAMQAVAIGLAVRRARWRIKAAAQTEWAVIFTEGGSHHREKFLSTQGPDGRYNIPLAVTPEDVAAEDWELAE